YYSETWQLLREVNHSSNLTTNYNYSGGLLSATESPSGQRTCVESDSRGKPTRITTLASSTYPGSAASQVTSIYYDELENVTEVIRNPEGALVSGRKVVRDKYQRPIAVADQVDATRAIWTCLAYEDRLLSLSGDAQVGPRAVATLITN